jgi:6-phosphogluconolactonase
VTFALARDSGELKRIGAIPTEASPRGMRLTPSGRFLAVVGEVSGNVALYTVDATTGELRRAAVGHAGDGANWVVLVDRANPRW